MVLPNCTEKYNTEGCSDCMVKISQGPSLAKTTAGYIPSRGYLVFDVYLFLASPVLRPVIKIDEHNIDTSEGRYLDVEYRCRQIFVDISMSFSNARLENASAKLWKTTHHSQNISCKTRQNVTVSDQQSGVLHAWMPWNRVCPPARTRAINSVFRRK